MPTFSKTFVSLQNHSLCFKANGYGLLAMGGRSPVFIFIISSVVTPTSNEMLGENTSKFFTDSEICLQFL